MKILHVLGSLNQKAGGPLRAVLDLSSHAMEHGLQSEILGFGDIRIVDWPASPCPIHSLSLEFPVSYEYSSELRPWCRTNLNRFQGVVLHGMWHYPNWIVASECQKRQIPYACFPHGMMDQMPVYGQGLFKVVKKWVYWSVRERHIFKHCRYVFFTTHQEMEQAPRSFGLDHPRTVLIPYGVEHQCSSKTASPSESVFQPQLRNVALFLGRLHPIKNIEFLLKSWQVASPALSWHLVLAGTGEGKYVDSLIALCKELQIESSVHFVGEVSGQDKRYLLSRAAWFVLPSLHENFGVAVLEAVNSGCAVAISDQVYLKDYFPSGAEVLPLEINAWATFLKDRLGDTDWQEQRRSQDTAELLRHFDMEIVARAWAATLVRVFGAGCENPS